MPQELSQRTIMLRYQTSRILDPARPFDLDGSVYRPDHFPSGDRHWEPGSTDSIENRHLIGYRVSSCSSSRLQAIQT